MVLKTRHKACSNKRFFPCECYTVLTNVVYIFMAIHAVSDRADSVRYTSTTNTNFGNVKLNIGRVNDSSPILILLHVPAD